ncbi:MAG: hypothetical protein PVF70_06650 [Anaerolineales bacterium]|jgi:hypothetical protein
MRSKRSAALLAAIGGLWLAGCGLVTPGTPTEPPPDHQPIRSPVTIDFAEVILLESFPVQAELVMTGYLPTPCHELEWQVSDPDDQNRIHLELYALADPNTVCIQVEEPFRAQVPLGSFSEGSFSIWLGGEEIGEFTVGVEPPDAGGEMGEGAVFVDQAEVILMESFPVLVVLRVSGHLPTPCHTLQWEVSDPDFEGNIYVVMASDADPEQVCIQVLDPFEIDIPLGDFTEGAFTVWLNGKQIESFDL